LRNKIIKSLYIKALKAMTSKRLSASKFFRARLSVLFFFLYYILLFFTIFKIVNTEKKKLFFLKKLCLDCLKNRDKIKKRWIKIE